MSPVYSVLMWSFLSISGCRLQCLEDPTLKPRLIVPYLLEGNAVTLRCRAPPCFYGARIYWKWTKNDGKSVNLNDFVYNFDQGSAHLNPTAEHHNTNITCLAEHENDVVETTVTLTVKFAPKILNDSHCLVKGELLVCVCVSWGNPLPPIVWPLKSFTDYSISSSSNSQKVSSIITLSAAEHHNRTMKCISINEVGQTETEILIKNSTEEQRLIYSSDEKNGFETALPWITAVCFSLDLVFITLLIFCIYQRSKMKQKKLCENTYASLRKAEVEDEYSVIPS